MIGVIFLILILFSIIWFLVWFWFFKPEKTIREDYYKLAMKAFELGDYKTAKEMFLKMPNINSNVDARYKLGIAYMKLKECADAQSCFEYVAKKQPKNLEVLFNLVQCLKMQEKYDDAIDVCNKIAKHDSKSVDIQLEISRIYLMKGDVTKALGVLEKTNKKFPNNSKVLLGIINCKSKMCNTDNEDACKQILEKYKEMANRDDLPSNFYIGIAKAYAMNGEMEKALQNCKIAVDMKSEDVEAYQLLGLIQLLKHDLAEAKGNLTIALNFQPNNRDTHNIFSYVLCQSVDSCTLSKCRENYFKLVKKYIK